MRSLHLLVFAPVGLVLASVCPPGIQAQASTPQQVVNELLDQDRAFSKASSQKDLVTGLSAMFADNVVAPGPGGKFARGVEAVMAALLTNKDNAGARAEWTPVRGGVSADGQHGFTFGYMTITKADGTEVPAKYLSYWMRKPEGWRVAVYKRSRAGKPPSSMDVMAPAVPAQLVGVSSDEQTIAAHRRSLDAAERAFSGEAQKIGLGPAFVKYGSADAINLGPPNEPAVIVGSEAIGKMVAASQPPGAPGLSWAPDSVIVASSGDLGVTIGMITPNGPGPDGKPAMPIPFFTIWRRASVADPWRYIAE